MPDCINANEINADLATEISGLRTEIEDLRAELEELKYQFESSQNNII